MLFFSWALANRDLLEEKSSSLEFKLHRLHFIDLLKQGPEKQIETLNYTKQFARFAYQHTKGLYSKTYLKGPLKKKTKNWFSRPIIA